MSFSSAESVLAMLFALKLSRSFFSDHSRESGNPSARLRASSTRYGPQSVGLGPRFRGDERRARVHRTPSCATIGSTPLANVYAVPAGMRKRPRARRVDTLAGQRPLPLTACSLE